VQTRIAEDLAVGVHHPFCCGAAHRAAAERMQAQQPFRSTVGEDLTAERGGTLI
jgi:hypothetical protein